VYTREADEAGEVFNKLMGVLNDFKTQHYQHWVETLESIDSAELQRRLEFPLIKKIQTQAEQHEYVGERAKRASRCSHPQGATTRHFRISHAFAIFLATRRVA